jgi:hypothetical protein
VPVFVIIPDEHFLVNQTGNFSTTCGHLLHLTENIVSRRLVKSIDVPSLALLADLNKKIPESFGRYFRVTSFQEVVKVGVGNDGQLVENYVLQSVQRPLIPRFGQETEECALIRCAQYKERQQPAKQQNPRPASAWHFHNRNSKSCGPNV